MIDRSQNPHPQDSLKARISKAGDSIDRVWTSRKDGQGRTFKTLDGVAIDRFLRGSGRADLPADDRGQFEERRARIHEVPAKRASTGSPRLDARRGTDGRLNPALRRRHIALFHAKVL